MPTSPNSNPVAQGAAEAKPIDTPLTLRDLTALLIKHYDLHEGLYNLLIEYQIGVGPVGPSPDQMLPGAMIAIRGAGLAAAPKGTANSVDAAEVNPRTMPRANRKKPTAKS